MDESILTSIKKLLGPSEDDTSFDTDIIIHINTAIMVLTQLGVGPSTGFAISDKTKTWKDFIGDRIDLEAIKTFIYLKVRLVFDPPTSTVAIEAMKEAVKEYEFRINVNAETNL